VSASVSVSVCMCGFSTLFVLSAAFLAAFFGGGGQLWVLCYLTLCRGLSRQEAARDTNRVHEKGNGREIGLL
jgi:hypothetical protein